MVALSIDRVEDHRAWAKVRLRLDERYWRESRLDTSGLYSNQDILAYNCEESESCELPFPIIADRRGELAVALGMLDPEEKDKDGMPLTARCASVQITLLLSFSELPRGAPHP